MTRKCEWCGKQSNELKEISVLSAGLPAVKQREIFYFVCPEHEQKLRGFYDRVRRYALLFLGLITLSLIGLITPTICSDNYWAGYLFIISFASIGLVIYIFPFCSPTTFEFMSVKTSIKLARIIGGVIFALGTIWFVLALLYG